MFHVEHTAYKIFLTYFEYHNTKFFILNFKPSQKICCKIYKPKTEHRKAKSPDHWSGLLAACGGCGTAGFIVRRMLVLPRLSAGAIYGFWPAKDSQSPNLVKSCASFWAHYFTHFPKG
jgi:hypothetical protein